MIKTENSRFNMAIVVAAVAIVFFAGIACFSSPAFANEGTSIVDEGIPYHNTIKKAARHFGVDPYLVSAVMMVESGGDPEAESPAGAQGLMQVTEIAAQEMNNKGYVSDVLYWKGRLKNPKINIRYGTALLAWNLSKYNDEKTAVAAYNGGSTNADRWVEAAGGGDIMNAIDIAETRAYVEKVETKKDQLKEQYPDIFESKKLL